MNKVGALSLLGVGAVALATVAMASERDQDRARELSEAGTIMPLEQILAQTRERYAGRVLETELEKKDSGYYYEVEIVDAEGVVRKLKYDAATGELLSDKKDD